MIDTIKEIPMLFVLLAYCLLLCTAITIEKLDRKLRPKRYEGRPSIEAILGGDYGETE